MSDDSRRHSLDYLSFKFKRLKGDYTSFKQQDTHLKLIKSFSPNSYSSDSDKAKSNITELCSAKRNVTPDSFEAGTNLKYNPAPNYVCPEISHKNKLKNFFKRQSSKKERNFNAEITSVQESKVMGIYNPLTPKQDEIKLVEDNRNMNDRKVQFANHVQVIEVECFKNNTEQVGVIGDFGIDNRYSFVNDQIEEENFENKTTEDKIPVSKYENNLGSKNGNIVTLFKRITPYVQGECNPNPFVYKNAFKGKNVTRPMNRINKGRLSLTDGREIMVTIQNNTFNYLIKLNIKEITSWQWKLSLVQNDVSKTITTNDSKHFNEKFSRNNFKLNKKVRVDLKNQKRIAGIKADKDINAISDSRYKLNNKQKERKSETKQSSVKSQSKQNKQNETNESIVSKPKLCKEKLLGLHAKHIDSVATKIILDTTKKILRSEVKILNKLMSSFKKQTLKKTKDIKRSINSTLKMPKAKGEPTSNYSKSSKLMDTDMKTKFEKRSVKSKSIKKKKFQKTLKANRKSGETGSDTDSSDSLFGFNTDSLFSIETIQT